MAYTDANGIVHESYEAACEHYGGFKFQTAQEKAAYMAEYEKAARQLLAALEVAVIAHGPLGDDSRPPWWAAANAAIAQAKAAGIGGDK